ncbi:MAG: ABC transporter ATP-binding protein [Candidatus Woesearchaeota archaeon]
MLQIKNLEAGYGNIRVLKGASITIKPCETVALVGPNGAGKSTVLKAIFNINDVYSGKILFKGKNITKIPTHELIELGISYVPQGRLIFSTMTVKENLEMGVHLLKDKDLIKKNMQEIFKKFPILKEKQQEYAFTLSGGQQQMLAIARALMQTPQILLLDEPSLGLSPIATKEIFKKIVEINKEGTAILIVEQNAKQAIAIADKTYVLEQGKIALKGGKNIIKNKKIKSIYLGGE